MKLKRMLVATAVAVSVATPALADLVIPSLVYRTVPMVQTASLMPMAMPTILLC